VLTKLIAFGRVKIPQGWDDLEFKREFMRVMVDIEKLLNGRKTSMIIRIIANFVLSACDRKVQFPLAKVI
jgi:hypothetical protein